MYASKQYFSIFLKDANLKKLIQGYKLYHTYLSEVKGCLSTG